MVSVLSAVATLTDSKLAIMQCLRILKTLVVITVLVPGTVSYNKTLYAAVEAETRLLHDLFEGYDYRARPVTKIDETIHVSFGISFQSLLELRETQEVMESISFMLTAWHDGRLAWNRSHYLGIDSIKIPANEIWRPDIVSYTSVDEDMHLGEAFAQVFATGHVYWNPTLFLRSPCKVNLRTFPFDKQTCNLVFASNMYHGNQLNLTYWGGRPDTALDVSDYSHTGWEMAQHSVNIKVAKTSCCLEPYPHMQVNLEFRRNPDFYVHMFVVPALLLGILIPASLLMPPESKERVTIGSIITLSVVLLEAKLCDMLPMGHYQLPALSIYYTLTLLWAAMSLICSIFVLNLHNRGARTTKVPDSVRWIFLRSLRRLVCLGSESYYPLSDTEFINMRGLDKAGSHQGQDRHSSIPQNQNEARLGGSPSPSSSKLEKDVEELTRQMLTMTSRFSKQENHQEIVSEWRQVALVIDRILFLLFLVVFLVCSVFLLA